MTADKTLLRMKYADIVKTLAARTGCSLEEALRRFYESREYRLVSNGIADQHCMTPDYIVDDILAESVYAVTAAFDCAGTEVEVESAPATVTMQPPGLCILVK